MSYRQHLRGVVAASAAPYGYTLTVWTSGAIATHAQAALPAPLQTLLLLVGAALGFGAVGTLAFAGINRPLAPGPVRQARVWGGMHLPSVGSSIGAVTALTRWVHGQLMWVLVGFVATAIYLSVLGGQFWVAAHRRPRHLPESVDRHDEP
jgi:hypothetical protein